MDTPSDSKPPSMAPMLGDLDGDSRSSVEGVTGSPKNHADHDHYSDDDGVRNKPHGLYSDESGDDGLVGEDKDFEDCLQRELKRQASAKAKVIREGGDAGSSVGVKVEEEDIETVGDGGGAVTLDDVLDIDIDDEIIHG